VNIPDEIPLGGLHCRLFNEPENLKPQLKFSPEDLWYVEHVYVLKKSIDMNRVELSNLEPRGGTFS
jgi:hypothetical protein